MKKLACLFCFVFFILPIYSQTFPKEEWKTSDNPDQAGWPEHKRDAYYRYVRDSTVVTGLMVIHKGEVVLDYGDLTENSYIASCRKCVLAMLYGKYVANGTIELKKTVGNLAIDDVEGILPREKEASVQDIISARSGVYHPEGYPGGMQEYAPERGSKEPGSYWLYSNWDFNVAGYIFEKETGKNIYDEVQAQLAVPLNMQDWDRSLPRKSGDTTKSKYLAYPMWFSTRDMARIGYLMLNKGNWGGKQLISKNWIDEMLQERTSWTELNQNVPVFRGTGVYYGYGYMWWLWQNTEDERFRNGYSAKGALGQNISVFPEIETVVVFKTKAAYRRRNSTQQRLNLVIKAIEMYEGN